MTATVCPFCGRGGVGLLEDPGEAACDRCGKHGSVEMWGAWSRAFSAAGHPDSLIFLTIAFGSTMFWQGQVLGKSYGIVLAATIIAVRRARLPRLVTA